MVSQSSNCSPRIGKSRRPTSGVSSHARAFSHQRAQYPLTTPAFHPNTLCRTAALASFHASLIGSPSTSCCVRAKIRFPSCNNLFVTRATVVQAKLTPSSKQAYKACFTQVSFLILTFSIIWRLKSAFIAFLQRYPSAIQASNSTINRKTPTQ